MNASLNMIKVVLALFVGFQLVNAAIVPDDFINPVGPTRGSNYDGGYGSGYEMEYHYPKPHYDNTYDKHYPKPQYGGTYGNHYNPYPTYEYHQPPHPGYGNGYRNGAQNPWGQLRAHQNSDVEDQEDF